MQETVAPESDANSGCSSERHEQEGLADNQTDDSGARYTKMLQEALGVTPWSWKGWQWSGSDHSISARRTTFQK